jgi:hypothetical protein
MKLLLVSALAALVVAAAAQAGRVTVVFEPATVAVGGQFHVEVCGTNSRLVDYTLTRPDGSVDRGQLFANDKCTEEYYLLVDAPLAGTYTLQLFNKNGNKLIGSGSGTAT